MNDKPDTKVDYVSPLKKICMTIGQLPTSYIETMSYYEMLIWFIEFLRNQVIPVVNNNSAAVQELQTLFIELQDYVNNYFDNLDVQEEINNKLDEMAQDGTLSEIIAEYLRVKSLLCYDTIDDMIASDNLVVGSYAKVLGYDEINDSYNSIWKIDETGDLLLNNGLYATLINNLDNQFYKDVTYEKKRYNNETDYYITTIPKYDENNELIELYVGDGENTYTPNQYAIKNNTNVTINASLSIKNSSTGTSAIPSIIANGSIIRQNDMLGSGIADNLLYLGIKADRSIVEYQVNSTSASQMIAEGVKQAFDVYWKLVENGTATDLTNCYTNEGVQADAVQGPRQWIGEKADGTILIFTCDGRSEYNLGLYSHDQQAIAIENGCVNAWNLDGGGSTSTSFKGVKINRSIDGNGTKDRNIRYTLNVKHKIYNKGIADIYGWIGKLKFDIFEQLLPTLTDNKLNVAITNNGRALTGESAHDGYYYVGLNRILGNEYSTELITLLHDDEENETGQMTKFKINKTGYFKITANVELITRAVQQNRINVYRVNQNYELPGSDVGTSSSLSGAQRVEMTTIGFINNRNVNHVYTIRVSTQDTSSIVTAGCVMIEEV